MTVQTSAPALVAGLKPVDRSFESWWVRPGAATAVELRGGDSFTVIDPDGAQPAELSLDDPGALGERESPIRLFGSESRRASRSPSRSSVTSGCWWPPPVAGSWTETLRRPR